jgi:GNAT superfamily N-acetyltransferase
VARIWEKLAEPQACLVIGHRDAGRDVLAMALAEPGRGDHGAGAVIPDYDHVSMVFVHPDMWGRGAGRQLLQGLHERASEKRLEPHDAMDPGVERTRSTPLRRPGIPKVRP